MIGKTLSYSAGSTSRDPYQFRVIDDTGVSDKMQRLVSVFTELPEFFCEPARALVVDSYPAALGGFDSMTRVITYLHAPTCSRALELAACEGWRAIFVAQPLAGTHLLLQAMEHGIRWPREMLWATGGYPLPASLESFVRQSLAEQGCRLSVLQAYGIAELDHTLLASMHRDNQARPIYQLIDQQLRINSDPNEGNAWLQYRDKRVPNLDRIEAVDRAYRIGGDMTRYTDQFQRWLEAWQPSDWEAFTGYFAFDGEELILQRRHQPAIAGRIGPAGSGLSTVAMEQRPDARLIRDSTHFAFVEQHGMSWLEKPRWSDPAIKQPGLASASAARSHAA